jgi:ABC-2 type transport system ATP-binding protein
MLKIDKLKKQYKNFTLNCSMEVKEGMITGFVGPNGSGKSTTLKAVLGLIYIDGGDIQIFGKNVKDIKPEDKEQIGVVLSDSGFSRYLTVKDIKDILKNTYEAFDEQLFTNYIEKYQLPTDKKLEQFSVGMKAKLKLITAICHKAKLLILDVNWCNKIACI